MKREKVTALILTFAIFMGLLGCAQVDPKTTKEDAEEDREETEDTEESEISDPTEETEEPLDE